MKVLLICARNYVPLDGGDKVVSYSLARMLGQLSELYVYNIADEPGQEKKTREALENSCRKLWIREDGFRANWQALLRSFATLRPYLETRRTALAARKQELGDIIAQTAPDVIIWDHFRSFSYYVGNSSHNVLLQHNDEIKIYEEKAGRFSSLLRPLVDVQVKLLKRQEYRLEATMQQLVYLNRADIHPPFKEKKVSLEYIMADFPAEDYQVKDRPQVHLLFLGSLDWYPNSEGISWFIEQVWPRLPEHYQLTVVGKRPSARMKALLEQTPRATLYADVPSTRPYFMNADIFISPVFVGSGINIKILEAASYGIPMVMSRFSKKGYEGLAFIPEADEETGFADQLLQLGDAARRQKINHAFRQWYADYNSKRAAHIAKIFLNI